ncbi:MAG TPA: Asp-tRNA(Asn)/Glu-tRNA(Gln) amidotransferase subunit GatA [Candidatus Pacebacteria bacterium]|uniref:Glutamyl-tRNA(Gln) amidotransferase subunit A n=1 Tax=Candidatus Curtissbacteria bacterium GW2011_GWA1_41_11 TaxID=1618409 RepID=A0A0G0UB89_9BACT|nr:MAG: Glutamyl-tRNA(Gln) amidotransferase subunit A [Candidatus Curtissbacteria bacterium GW2011_GWA1_41_11]HCR92375.1 Asp-tRNA(Asn)/Glu-tRNA(Gln) amidotransferase subunit GatA [Candidatus Paceibacterota bacterium]
MDIFALTIEQALEGYRAKKFTAVDVVKTCLENVRKYNKEYNVLLTVRDEDELIKEAKSVDYSKPLAGIPVVLKDLFSTNLLRTTGGAKIIDTYVPRYDATVVRKLKESGAIIIGKANEDAWGHGSSGENSDFGPTRNAYNKNHVAGGSSSGSGVAVALGMCLFGTGTDTGGSIRMPAAYNNLVGLKPTYGRVSRYGILAMASSLDTIGHVTKTVGDNALVLSITAGKDPLDATTDTQPVARASFKRSDLKGLKIGVSPEYLAIGKQATPGMDEKLEAVTETALKELEKLGATIVTVNLPNTQPALATYYVLVPSEISSNLGRYDGVRFGHTRETFGGEAKRRMMIGTYALSSGYYDAYYKTGQKVRTLVRTDFTKAFESVDAIFAPVSPYPAPKIGDFSQDPLAVYLSDIYTVPINLAGVAALGLPAGFIGDLPVGIQLIGPQWSEERLYEIGFAYEQETQWYKRKPIIEGSHPSEAHGYI